MASYWPLPYIVKYVYRACNFIKKETLTQVFSCEFCEIFKKTIFTEHMRTAASERPSQKNLSYLGFIWQDF